MVPSAISSLALISSIIVDSIIMCEVRCEGVSVITVVCECEVITGCSFDFYFPDE